LTAFHALEARKKAQKFSAVVTNNQPASTLAGGRFLPITGIALTRCL